MARAHQRPPVSDADSVLPGSTRFLSSEHTRIQLTRDKRDRQRPGQTDYNVRYIRTLVAKAHSRIVPACCTCQRSSGGRMQGRPSFWPCHQSNLCIIESLSTDYVRHATRIVLVPDMMEAMFRFRAKRLPNVVGAAPSGSKSGGCACWTHRPRGWCFPV